MGEVTQVRYDVIFFDLDGTLLGLDMEVFLPAYFQHIGKWVSTRGMDPGPFLDHLVASTEAMLQSEDPERKNKDVFLEHFLPSLPGLDQEGTVDLFDRFYEEAFPDLRSLSSPIPEAIEVVRALRGAGCRLVLATNPVFPRRAIDHRLRWAGLDLEDFEHITSYENSFHCKPRLQYYRDLLDLSGVSPGSALMVGNDPWEDMIAGELGMDTFLVDGYVVVRPEEVAFPPTYQGSLSDVVSVAVGSR